MAIPKTTSVFVDTGYWIALLDKADCLHHKAIGFLSLLKTAQVFTSEMVFTEVLNYFSSSGPTSRLAAVNLVRKMQTASNVTIIPQDSELFIQALTVYEDRHDKHWSLTDCASFRSMNDNTVYHALAHDKHFEQAGFVALLRDS